MSSDLAGIRNLGHIVEEITLVASAREHRSSSLNASVRAGEL
jgi:hypothetical protein